MSRSHTGRFHRSIAMLMVIVMPMCCCILNAAAFGSCCGPEEAAPVAVVSCCSSQPCDAEPAESPAESQHCQDSNCDCCLRAPVQCFEWTPPTDTIGSISLQLSVEPAVFNPATLATTHLHWEPPPPGPGMPAFLRGDVILQV
ncbi:MAG: hypothetical protein MK089_03875 [Phycisphaerales bacterium]|nr:hypothetical protein [Phycisphaerales bacterium]